jgi:hypothetical protein
MNKIHRIESLAYEESLKTKDTKQFFGCLIMKHKRIQSRGHNFRAFDHDSCCCHAEMDAMYHHLHHLGLWKSFYRLLKISYWHTGILRKCSKVNLPSIGKVLYKRTKYKMFIFRFHATGERSNARPCAECSRWIAIAHQIGVEYDIYYTDENQKISLYRGDCNNYSPLSTYF